ncbi:UNVERIFIED_CONTAM: hypothetical protein GTU68_056332 [Idotea baltica]|nr:hypothetical protein [Idotea baltica]
MVLGVSQGWKKSLVLNGVGFTATLSGDQLKLVVGYSHDVFITIPKEVNCAVTKTTIDLDSADKQLVGNLAASIRKVCPPEPYLGKGIKYSDEIISDESGSTLASASSKDKELNTSSSTKSVDTAKEVGTLLAKRAVESGLSKVIFDRNGFVYHGRIKALADGAREGGLKF